jgi:1,4-alpha-glucan branching enzyme
MLKITKKGNKAWVTFSIVPESDEKISLYGDWNDWEEEEMKVKKSGEFYLTKVLPCENEYQFGYKVNNKSWICDSDTKTVNSPFGTKNSILEL